MIEKTDKTIENVERKQSALHDEAEKLEARLLSIKDELGKWNVFVEQWKVLRGAKKERPVIKQPDNGKPRLMKGTIAALAAETMSKEPSRKMTIERLLPELVKSGVGKTKHTRVVIYNGMKRRTDVFKKIGKGEFELICEDFEVVDK